MTRIETRPTVGRLTVPYMVDEHQDPIRFTELDPDHVAECARRGRCGICGGKIKRGPIAFIESIAATGVVTPLDMAPAARASTICTPYPPVERLPRNAASTISFDQSTFGADPAWLFEGALRFHNASHSGWVRTTTRSGF